MTLKKAEYDDYMAKEETDNYTVYLVSKELVKGKEKY